VLLRAAARAGGDLAEDADPDSARSGVQRPGCPRSIPPHPTWSTA
jgi:hypothetical protein